MNHRGRASGWLEATGVHWQEIIRQADDIRSLKERGCTVEALQVEHDAIELILNHLGEAVLCGASRAEVIEILNAAVDFCGTHFTDEESSMRKSGYAHLDAHILAHRHLLGKFVAARRSASGDGLPLATLDAVDLLHQFHEHVKTYDLAAQPLLRNTPIAHAAADPPVAGISAGADGAVRSELR
jgi:hemerythrin-like metal-binding protein